MDGQMRWIFPAMNGFAAGLMIPSKVLACIVAIAVCMLTRKVNEDCLEMISEDE